VTRRRARQERAFTLLEMALVAALVTSLLIFVVQLSLEVTTKTVAASRHTRTGRQATALLDHISRDLEGATLIVRPPGTDPLSHPWLFLAESRGISEGADRIKFATRSHVPSASAAHESDLAQVAYFLSPGDRDGYELHRWTSSQLPESLDRRFPAPDDDGVTRFADRIESFGVRLMDQDGEWTDEWDSSTLLRSNDLPIAAEIWVSFLPDAESDAEGAAELVQFQRKVLLPLRPFDLASLLAEAGAEGEDEDEDDEEEEDDEADGCFTVAQCISKNQAAFDLLAQTDPGLAQSISSLGDQCYSEYAGLLTVPVVGCQ